MSDKRVIRYSEAFKQEVVREVEEGRFGSPHEAAKAYGIRGNATVYRWLKEYGKSHLLRKVVRVEKPGEPGEIKRLQERVRELETALTDEYIDRILAESFFKILCERTNTDGEAFKKKHAGTASTLRRRGRRASQE